VVTSGRGLIIKQADSMFLTMSYSEWLDLPPKKIYGPYLDEKIEKSVPAPSTKSIQYAREHFSKWYCNHRPEITKSVQSVGNYAKSIIYSSNTSSSSSAPDISSG